MIYLVRETYALIVCGTLLVEYQSLPATGTPEPGGMFWEDVLPIIKKVCRVSNIVGADINELAPIKGFNSYNFLVAKLAYKIISYIFLLRKTYNF